MDLTNPQITLRDKRISILEHNVETLRNVLKDCITSENAHCFKAGTIGMVRRIEAINENVLVALKKLEEL